jgi:DNA polymerase III epsilon subunit family exonuclease
MATAGALPEPVFIVFDVETTGLEAGSDDLIELGAVPIIDGAIREDCAFQSLVDPDRPIPPESTRIHGITDEMVQGQPRIELVLPEFLRYCGPHALVAQNADFDMGFLRVACERLELPLPAGEVHDTMLLSRQCWPGTRKHSLDRRRPAHGARVPQHARAPRGARRPLTSSGPDAQARSRPTRRRASSACSGST